MKTLVSLFIFFVLCFAGFANEDGKYSISGHITDENGEALIGATVYVKDGSSGVVSNLYGFYSLKLPVGTYEVVYSYIGYKDFVKKVSLTDDIKENIMLQPETQELEAVEIRAQRKDVNVKSISMSSTKLETSTIKKIPVLMGETDVIKSIQLLPGVQTSVEGSSGFYVRGGNADQNLILLDGATVYNAAHLFGFFSVFNGDAIKHVELYKGGIPSEYGGRLSSVLDVRMKEGNTRKIQGEGGIGTISSRFTIDGPIVKDKVSFMLSGRRTYADLMLPFAKDTMAQKSKVFFYDLNAKINVNISERDRLFISGYFGRDVNKFGEMFSMNYGNKTGTVRWNHVYNGSLFSNLTYIYSNFDYDLGVPSGSDGFKWLSNIIDQSIKNDYTWYINPENTMRFGFQTTYHVLKPGVSQGVGESFISDLKFPNSYALENAIFASNEQAITPQLSVQYGLRLSSFHNMGKGTIYSYEKNEKTTDYDVADTTYYKSNEIFNNNYGLEPRLGIRYMINSKNSIKASYNRTFQYLHLASNSTATFPLDLWFFTSPNVKPQKADQVAVGYFRNWFDNMLETSVEVYYKKMYNTIDFKDHAYLVPNQYLEGELRFGKAYSYGAEFMVNKTIGKFSGWISYTYSRTYREIPEVNNGEKYSPPYDKPHNISIVGSYDLNDRWTFAANWVYTSANPVTVPVSGFSYGNMTMPTYTERNGVRIPGTEYHRLDISATYNFKMFKKLDSNINLSIYNVYNRHNTFAVYFRDKNAAHVIEESTDNKRVEVVKLYLFPIVPSLTLNVKF
ncbi:MAG: TonB-dependent receptor [Bacteroidales bacterium]|nr:TonB-dependent receptor [Bacteroidales bacterium]